MPSVIIDPDGTLPEWTYVVVEGPTGVLYEHQFGGTANRQGSIEGYLVPVDGRDALLVFHEVFVSRLKSVGSWGKLLEEPLVAMVREAVGTIRFWPTAQGSPTVEQLVVDNERLGDLDEAWVPVLTSDGPGILIWGNSD